MTLGSPIFRKLLLAGVLLIGVTVLIADTLLTRYVGDRERVLVQNEMAQVARILAPTLSDREPAALAKWVTDADQRSGYRVTVIDASGVVLADSQHNPESMENHRNRPEVRAALEGKPGADIRQSATLDVDFCYSAIPIESVASGRGVLRLALPLNRVDASVAAVRGLIWRASAFATLTALIIAYLIARSFTKRIRQIQNYAKELVNADYLATPAVQSDDELGSVAMSLRSMAEQFRKMMALVSQESSRREAIMSSMMEGVLAVDRELRVTFCNGAFVRAVHARLPVPPNTSVVKLVRDPALRQLLERVVTSGESFQERMTLIGAGGRTFYVQAVPLQEQGNNGAIATLHDITELERLERVRKDFVANMSHELRTPLAAIRGYTETLLDGALDDPQSNRKFLEIIEAHTARLSDLAADALALSELEAERVAGPPERVSVLDVARSVLAKGEEEARERRVFAFLGAADEAYIAGQRAYLERALLHLLLNGIKYNREAGEVRIDVRNAAGAVRISVSDTGIGIPAEDLSRVFERFYRVDKARSRQTGGTGLGLSIVRHTAEQMGGSVSVESQMGKGSVFTLVFPAI